MDGRLVGQAKRMYNIRLAKAEDWEKVAPMCAAFYRFSTYSFPYVEEDARQQFLDIVQGAGEVILAEHEGTAVGMLGFAVHPFPTNRNVLIGTEIVWWVEKEHRGSVVGTELLYTAEQIAKRAYGAEAFNMSKLHNSSPKVADYYKSVGYAETDTSYMKVI